MRISRGRLMAFLFATLATTPLQFVAGSSEAQQTVALVGNHPPQDERLTSAPPSSKVLQLRIIFALRDKDGLDKLLAEQQDKSSSRYHRWLSPEEFEHRFGQPRAEVQEVRRWLVSTGIRVSSVTPNEILAIATVQQAEKAFSVTFVASSDGSLYANRNDPTIPTRLSGVVRYIDGLDNLRQAKPLAIPGPTLLPGQNYFKPSDFRSFYNENPLLNAGIDGHSLAHPKPGPRPVYECGIAFPETSDFRDDSVRAFNAAYSLPNLPIGPAGIQRVFPSGNPGRTSSEDEALLDIEWGHAVAPGAIIYVYISGDLYAAITRAISDGRCGAVSISFEFCGVSGGFYQDLDSWFKRAATQGQSVFVASGDYGAAASVPSGNSCVASKSLGVNEMAASQYATGVGGTQFNPNYDANGNNVGYVPETAWSNTEATGGGRSSVFAKPAYQNNLTPADGVRDVPDVAFGASNFTPGFFTFINPNTPSIYGGTSIAAPMWAGVARLISQKARPTGTFPRAPNARLGNMNPEIYKLKAAVNGIRDVVTGNNNFNGVTGFTAGPGYDQTTGWGTVDITTFVNAYTADVCSQCP